MADRLRSETVVVIGLGRFGTAVATELQTIGHEVLGIDLDESLVQSSSGELDFVVQADATDPAVLRQLGVESVQHAVVAIGDAIQASILATAALTDLAIPDIWAKAQTAQHARILERVGAHHVVFPERDMGERIAHRVTGTMIEYFEIDEHFALVEVRVPGRYAGRTLLDSGIRGDYGVNVVGIRPEGGRFGHVEAGTVLGDRDVLLVSGDVRQVERFAAQS